MTESFDHSRYVTLPRTTGTRYLSVSRLLRQHAPSPHSDDLAAALAQLAAVEATVTEAYIARHREYGPSLAAREQELDTVVDALLGVARDRLEHWSVFEKPGIARLLATQKPDGFDFEVGVARAQRAKAIVDLLLARGLGFTQAAYVDQAEAMRTLDALVQREQLGPDLDQLVGAELMSALRAVQAEYYAMVEARTLRARGSAVNLSELNRQLKQAIERYLFGVIASLRDDDPDSLARVRAALRPIDALRELIAYERSGQTGEEVEGEEMPVDPAIDELLGEQRSVEDEVGLSETAAE